MKFRSHILVCFSLWLSTFATASPSPKTLSPYKVSVGSLIKNRDIKTTMGNSPSLFTFPAPQETKHWFLIEGGLHGNELLTSEFVLWLAERYAKGESALNRLPQSHKLGFDFLPYANPDGTIMFSRYNSRGINLNRNFGVLWGMTKENPGEASFSEVETGLIKSLMEKRRYTAAVDVHGYVNWVVVPSEPKSVKESKDHKLNYEGWYKAALKHMTGLGDYEVKTPKDLGDGGAFEDWAYWQNKTFALCLEMKSPQRFVGNFVDKVFDALRPLHMLHRDQAQDMFIAYETFIAGMFVEAIELKGVESKPSKDLASRSR